MGFLDTNGVSVLWGKIKDRFLDKSSTGISVISGKLQVGNNTTNTTNAYLHIRNVGTSNITGKKVNGACFSVNGDGTASFQHKIYNDDGSNARNAAVMRFYGKDDKTGKIQFAVNTGTASTPTEAMYKDLATVDDVNSIVAEKIKDIPAGPPGPSGTQGILDADDDHISFLAEGGLELAYLDFDGFRIFDVNGIPIGEITKYGVSFDCPDGDLIVNGNVVSYDGHSHSAWKSFSVTADTTNTINIRSQACSYNQELGIVNINVQIGITASAAIAAGARIPVLNIPAAYRPKQIEALAASHVQSGTTAEMVNAWAHNSGPIYIRKSLATSANAASDYIHISGMWHV